LLHAGFADFQKCFDTGRNRVCDLSDGINNWSEFWFEVGKVGREYELVNYIKRYDLILLGTALISVTDMKKSKIRTIQKALE
jgi:hypothetical protein